MLSFCNGVFVFKILVLKVQMFKPYPLSPVKYVSLCLFLYLICTTTPTWPKQFFILIRTAQSYIPVKGFTENVQKHFAPFNFCVDTFEGTVVSLSILGKN